MATKYKEEFNKEIVKKLQDRLKIKNAMAVPRFMGSVPLHSSVQTASTSASRIFSSTIKLVNGIALSTLVLVTVKSHLEDDEGHFMFTIWGNDLSSNGTSTTTTLNRHKTKNPLTLVGTMPEGEHHHHHEDQMHHHDHKAH